MTEPNPASPEWIENRTYDQLQSGDTASLSHVLTPGDVALFAAMSGDVNPTYMDAAFARSTEFREIIGHGMWGGSLVSAVLGTQLPGPGTVYLSQSLEFERPVHLGDEVTVTVTVIEKGEGRRVRMRCVCTNQRGETVIAGEAVVLAPQDKVRRAKTAAPRAMVMERGERLAALIEQATTQGPPLATAVVHPCDARSLAGAVDAMEKGLIAPVLVGPRARLEAAAREAGVDLERLEVHDVPHSHAAAERAVALAREGRVGALMKGSLHTDEVMGAVVARDTGLRTERRISHIYVMDAPAYPRLLLITDAAINIYPDLEAKRDIIQNAIDLAQAIGIAVPKVAILSAMETVYPRVQSTLDAAALCKMADRGQISGGLLDGPLAFDNAIDEDAAQAKGIVSPVAGRADILITPDLEAGNMLAKQLDYLGGAVAAGVVLGARVPVILTSRAEGPLARVAASAIAKLYAQRPPVKP